MAFKNNSILIKEKPFACVVKRDYISTTCASCFRQNIKLLKCSQCDRSYYCNRECQKKDWKQHKIECKCIATIIDPSDVSLLTLRIMSKFKNGRCIDTDYLTVNKFGLKPRCFDDLMSNQYDDQSNISEGFDQMIVQLNGMFESIGLKMNAYVSRDVAKIIFSKSVTNNFEIQDDNNVTIGFGCYLNGSSLDHSCWPNSAYSFSGNELIVRAIKTINPGDKVCINYTDTLQLRDDRRQHLREQYVFECQCEACCDDELDREMSQLYCECDECQGSVMRVLGTEKFKCNRCGVIVDEDIMATKHSIFRAELYHINQLMVARNYQESYDRARSQLDYFQVPNQPSKSGGLVQLCLGEKAFESALFLGDYESALEVCGLGPGDGSWMHERLVRFLGSEHHPVALRHQEKYLKVLGIL